MAQQETIFGTLNFGENSNEQQQENNEGTFPIFGLQSFAPQNLSDKLQNIYGTKALPVFEWVKSIQTGTGTFANEDDESIQAKLQEYKDIVDEAGGQTPEGYMSPTQLEKALYGEVARQVAGKIGADVGRAVADPYLKSGVTSRITGETVIPETGYLGRVKEGIKTSFTGDPLPAEQVADYKARVGQDYLAKQKLYDQQFASDLTASEKLGSLPKSADYFYEPTDVLDPASGASRAGGFGQRQFVSRAEESARLANEAAAAQRAKVGMDAQRAMRSGAKIQGADAGMGFNTSTPTPDATAASESVVRGPETSLASDSVTSTKPGFFSKQELTSTAYQAGAQFAVNLAMGMKPKKAARQAAKATAGSKIGAAIGTAVTGGSPLGGTIGSVIGAAVGAKVICNELRRQGLMPTEQVLISYKFADEFLTKNHVNGYHFWAVHVVKQMRKGRMVNFWKHIAVHRANEIQYIYGKKSKPDWLGKVYRKIFEPICWLIGVFCSSSDWTKLYKNKEI